MRQRLFRRQNRQTVDLNFAHLYHRHLLKRLRSRKARVSPHIGSHQIRKDSYGRSRYLIRLVTSKTWPSQMQGHTTSLKVSELKINGYCHQLQSLCGSSIPGCIALLRRMAMGHQSCNHTVSGLRFSTTAVPKRISIQTTVTVFDLGAVAEAKRRAKQCGWAFNGAVERSVEA